MKCLERGSWSCHGLSLRTRTGNWSSGASISTRESVEFSFKHLFGLSLLFLSGVMSIESARSEFYGADNRGCRKGVTTI